MEQQKLPELWYLKVGDDIEVNENKYTIQKIETIDSCHPEHCNDEKTFYLNDDYLLDITLNKDNIETEFCKIIRPDPNTKEFKKIELKTLKILKKN